MVQELAAPAGQVRGRRTAGEGDRWEEVDAAPPFWGGAPRAQGSVLLDLPQHTVPGRGLGPCLPHSLRPFTEVEGPVPPSCSLRISGSPCRGKLGSPALCVNRVLAAHALRVCPRPPPSLAGPADSALHPTLCSRGRSGGASQLSLPCCPEPFPHADAPWAPGAFPAAEPQAGAKGGPRGSPGVRGFTSDRTDETNHLGTSCLSESRPACGRSQATEPS